MKILFKRFMDFDFGVRSKDRFIIVLPVAFLFFYAYLLEPGQRLFLPFWVSAYVLGLVIFYVERRKSKSGKSMKEALAFLFPKDVWCHPSTLNDCMMAVVNGFIWSFLKLLLAALPIAVLGSVGYFIFDMFSVSQNEDTPPVWVVGVYTLCVYLASDFSYYWAHRFAHQSKMWWELHKVHHSAEVMTPITLARYHPIDNFLYAGFKVSGKSLMMGFFLYLYPSMPGVVTVMSTSVVVLGLEFLGNNLRHSHIWLSFGPRVERYVISPAMHQIHHSVEHKHWDKNFGATFSVWDRMFGTLYIPEGREDVAFGIGADRETERYDTLPKLLFGPLVSVYGLVFSKTTKTENK